MSFLTEPEVEESLIEQFRSLGYGYATDSEIGPDGMEPQRETHGDVILLPRLTAAVKRLNPSIPEDALVDAIRKVLQTETPSLITENRRIHKLLTEGVPVEFDGPDGTIRGGSVRLIDFHHPDNNDWLATNQYTVIEAGPPNLCGALHRAHEASPELAQHG